MLKFHHSKLEITEGVFRVYLPKDLTALQDNPSMITYVDKMLAGENAQLIDALIL